VVEGVHVIALAIGARMRETCGGIVGARLQFGILGPLEVRRDGAVMGIGGPRQRALLALLLCNPNRVLSRDRLIDELLAGQPGRSPERMLRVQVHRLRKALATVGDEPRVIARPPGYMLRVEAGELDLHAVQGLVREGQAALEQNDPRQAAALLREADELWRGPPLADLEFEPFARFEAQRLEELRLAALEDRIEAELTLGRHAALCAELTTLTGDYPLRERLGGQLMLALYRSGRQAEALAVYRQTGQLLREELGLEPGRALRELERSILKQDSHLDNGGRRSRPTPVGRLAVCPFKGLEFFDRGDASYFFGRERIVADVLARLADSSLVGILGPSGIGKSSLIRAGVLSALRAGELPGSASWRQVLLRPGERPFTQLARVLGSERLDVVLARVSPGERLVLAVDQFEELFTTCESEEERAAFLEQLWVAASDEQNRALVLVVLRGDFYMRFASHRRFAELLTRSHVLVGPMDHDELARAIEQPAARAGLEIERPLVDALVSDAAAQTGGLPLLSAMLVELWRARDGRVLRYQSYRASGGMHAAVARLAEAAYARLGEPQRRVARSVMLRLAREQDGALARRRAPVAELERIDGAQSVIPALIDARLLTVSDGKIELSHEALLREWPRYRAWLEEDRVGRRVHAHLTAAAAEWEAQDRDPGELYRGARLVGALDWAAEHGDRLNSLEREFLERSRLESERRQRGQRAQNRLLRGLLLAVAVLLIIAVAAAIVARVKQQSASNQARAAIARQLGSEAVNEPRLDFAMLMAREAVNLNRSTQTEGTLLSTLLRSPAVIGTIALPANTTAKLAVSPDGRTLAVGDGLGELRLYNTRTHATTAPPLGDLSEAQPPVYSRDGTLLAYLSGACHCSFISVQGAHSLQAVANLSLPASAPITPSDIPGGSIAIAPDDRTLYYAYWILNSDGRPTAAYVQRWALPDGRALPPARVGSNALLAMRLIHAGSQLLLVTRRSIDVFDARSLRLLRATAITPVPAAAGAASISPDGRTAVIGSRAGLVSFIDTSTGKLRPATEEQAGGVANVVYAPDGRMAVSVGNDDTVMVWDLRTAKPNEVLTGPPGQVTGVAISPNGTTLYTSSLDGILLEWDLAGARRFGARAPVDAPLPCCASLLPPAPPLAMSPDGSRFAVRLGATTVGLFSSRTLKRLASVTIAPNGNVITALAWSPAGDELALAGHAGLVQLWSTEGTPRLLRSLVGLRSMFGQPEAIQAVAFSPDGELVAASDDDKAGPSVAGASGVDFASLSIWQATTGRLVASPSGLNADLGHANQPAGDDLLAFSPDGKLLALSMFDRTILILDASTGQIRQILDSVAGSTSLAFAPDGTLAAGTPAGTVELWNPLTGKQVASPLVVAASAVTSITFDPAGQRFATTGAEDGTVKLWLTAKLQQEGPGLTTDAGATSAAEFEPGSNGLLAVDDNGNAFTWPTTLAAWEHQACTVAGRNFTHQEWAELDVGPASTAVCQ
jgi:WD40 repeat protein/DNA-binding SARP family transcriptional activator